jgi:hypothetical protein
LSFIIKHGVFPGARVIVKKSGEIINAITSVIEKSPDHDLYMKEYLDLSDDNFSVRDIASKLSTAMRVDKVIEDPIKLYLAHNVNEEDAAIIKEKHKAYLNYKH